MQFMAIDVDGILRSLWASLCQLIYKLIAFLYELFMNIASVKLLTQYDIKPIYQRVTMILAIIMVFYVTLEVVKYVVQPDKMTDKEKGASNIVKSMIIVVLLIAFVPMIFEKAYDLQNSLLKNQVFSKMILGRQNNDMEKVGKEFSANMFSLFYKYDDEFWESQGKSAEQVTCDGASCKKVVQLNISTLATDGELPYIHMGLNEKLDVVVSNVSNAKKQEVRKITFDGLLAVVVGVFIAYVLLMYCIDVGVRVAQLLFLQVIAPIPIIGYLAPKKDGIFQKWVKQCVTTYLDLFLRLAIICFVLLIVEILGDAYHSHTLVNGVGNVSGTMKTFMYIAIVMGLLLFAQKAPKMLQELFPKMGAASGNFGLKAGERVAPAAARAIGGSFGLARGLVGGAIRRNRWRTARNKANGWSTGFSRFTREGRENNRQKREEERTHRQELRQSRRQHRETSQNARQKQKFDEARDAWNKSVQGNERVNTLKQQIRDAHNRGDIGEARRLGAELQNEYKNMQNSTEYRQWNAARNKMKNSSMAQGMRDRNANNIENRQRARRELDAAYEELEAADASGDQNRIAAANRRVDEASQRLRKSEEEMRNQQQSNKNFFTGNAKEQFKEQLEEAEQNLERANEQVIDDKNQSFKGFAGSAVSTAAGAVRTGLAGAKATKLGDIHKQVQQGVKNDIASVKAVQKYYDDGGTGWVDRTVQQVEKRVGMPTAYERTVLQNHALEPKIKRLEAQAALTSDVKSTADGAEDRLKDKINDLKLSAEGRKIKTVDINGNNTEVQVQAGETLGAVYRRYQGMEAKAQTDAETAAKRLDDFRASHSNVELPLDENAPLTAEQQELKRLQQDANLKATQASNAKYATTLVHKNAARAEFSAILQEFATRGITNQASAEIRATDMYENVAVEKVYDALKSLEVARSNPEVVEGIRINLGDNVAAFNAFMTGHIYDFDTLDKIKTAAINAGNTYNRDAKAAKEEKRSSETSNKTSAQKAAQDYNPPGSSGGK